MGTRLELQNKFEEILGSRNVYYKPPENLKMKYPAIRYNLSEIDSRYADDFKYSTFNRYDVIVIDTEPDNEVIQKILELPYTSFERSYVADNLYHDLIRIYF